MASKLRFFVSAGERSGDRHGADLIEAIRRRRPLAEFRGVGGPSMAGAGCTLHHDMTAMSVMWWVDVFRNLRTFIRVFERTVRGVSAWKPHLLVPIDYPGFNLRLADRTQQSGVPVLYFISPQVWAWWRYRIHPISERVNHMAVVLPFEQDLYQEVGLETTYVGHPIVDQCAGFTPDDTLFPPDPSGATRLVGLLPGSRRREIRANLPVMCEAASLLASSTGELRFAAAVPDASLEAVARTLLDKHLPQTPCYVGKARDLMARADFCFVCAGSATLELAYFGTPMAVVYRIKPQAWILASLLMAVDRIALVNIVAGKTVVPEYLAVRNPARALADDARRLLGPSPQRDRCIRDLHRVRDSLGPPGAVDRLADLAIDMAEREAARRERFT